MLAFPEGKFSLHLVTERNKRYGYKGQRSDGDHHEAALIHKMTAEPKAVWSRRA